MSDDERGIDLGHDHWLSWNSFDPDLTLNPRYAPFKHLLPIERYGATILHPAPEGSECRVWFSERHGDYGAGAITFESEVKRFAEPDRPAWTLEDTDPPTFSPSIVCMLCGDHGFVREGRWVPA